MQVAFAPNATVSDSASLSIRSNSDAGSPKTVPLSGTGQNPPAPVNTTAPSISGTAQQGQTLTADHGTWTPSPTGYGYQWQDCDSQGNSCTNITGATSQTYTPASSDVGDTIRVAVTATGAGGSLSRASATTGTVAAAPTPTAPTSTSPTNTTPTTPVQVQITGISVTGTRIVWCQDDGCGYPTTSLGFVLNRATTVRLVLRTRVHGHYKQVATATLNGHQGINQHRIPGRWHGHLFPTGPVQILVQIQPDHHWTTAKTIGLTVRHTR